MSQQEQTMFRVIDLKQYAYCPRIVYYHTVLPGVRPTTYKMDEGIIVHEEEDIREKRRQLRTYGIESGERHFHVRLSSEKLSLSGEVDLVIETENELIPIDFKNAQKVAPHYKLQLAAYGELLKLREFNPKGKAVRRGFLYLIPLRTAFEVRFTPALNKKIRFALDEMQAIAYLQRMPPATSATRKCVDCEFRRFCNDVM